MQHEPSDQINQEPILHDQAKVENRAQTTQTDNMTISNEKRKSADLEGRLAFVKSQHDDILQGLYREIDSLQNRNRGTKYYVYSMTACGYFILKPPKK